MRYNPWQVTLASEAVEEEVLALPADMQARYLRLVDLIEAHGPASLGMPHVRHLDGKLWELRITGRDGIARAVYIAASGRRVVILYVFVKKTQKTPRRALDTARQRMKGLDL
jgi:phage-related protein